MLLSYKFTRNISKSLNTSFMYGCQRNDRLLLRIPLNKNYRECRRLSSSKNSKFSRIWNQIGSYMYEPESSRFESSSMERVHKYDKKDLNEWVLIYRDIDASRISSVFSICFPIISMVLFTILGDIFINNNCNDRFSITQRLTNDCLELGILIVIPFTLMFVVSLGLLRINYLRPLRIYQSFSNPDNYVVVVPQLGRSHKQIKFARSNSNGKNNLWYISSNDSETFDNKKILNSLIYGNSFFADRKFFLDDKCWRSNEIRNYMFKNN